MAQVTATDTPGAAGAADDRVATAAAAPRARLHARVLGDGRRIYWWLELALIVTFYAVYSAIRNANEGGEVEAFRHARDVLSWQRALGLSFEETWQDWALNVKPLVVAANYFYGSLHFVVTGGAIVYLFRRHSDDYPLWRNALACTTALALVGFVLWPLMPPRLLPGTYGFVDTMARYPTFWSFNSGTMQSVSNQFAAMPSLHFAWALFCACALLPRVQWRPARWALVAYPVLTVVAIVITGNHYWLDAAGGAVVFALGYAVARRWTRAGRAGRAGRAAAAPAPTGRLPAGIPAS